MATVALACGKGQVVVDIIGSQADNTEIIFPVSSLDLEIIGSSTNNTQVLSKAPVKCNCNIKDCRPDCQFRKPECRKKPEIPHLGVDAWYGTFWYSPINLPKWPQV
jgi:hypothetical protein